MWNQNLLDKIEEIYLGQSESAYERNLVRKYMVFYGQDQRGDHYAVGYERVMDYRAGRKPNPFVWLEYELTHETVFQIDYNVECKPTDYKGVCNR